MMHTMMFIPSFSSTGSNTEGLQLSTRQLLAKVLYSSCELVCFCTLCEVGWYLQGTGVCHCLSASKLSYAIMLL